MESTPIITKPEHDVSINESTSYRKILNIYRACAVLEVVLDAALAPIGLSTAQWGTLRIVQDHPGASGADIARFAFVTPQAVTTMLHRLEQAKLIARRPSRGRVVKTYLTPDGEQLLREADSIAKEVEVQFFSNFSTEEQKHYNDYLLRSINNVDPNK